MAKDETTFWRTVVQVEVLSEDTPWDGELTNLAIDVIDGDCSGQMTIKKLEQVPAKKMAKLLMKQGSDPEFFRLNKDGTFMEED